MKLFSAFRSMSTLSIALGMSVAIHAALLTVRFVAPEQFNRVFQDTPLEVILVNAHTQERPEKAQAIAQAALAGGGDAAQGRATSPLPYSALTAIGDDFEERQKKLDALQEQQTVLLTQLRKQLAALPEFDPREVSRQQDQEQQEQKRKQLVKLLAEIEKRITVNHDGHVLDTEIVQGSGNPQLDQRAQAIARAAGPFGHFGPAMRAKADQIAVVSRFKFTRDQTLETNVR